MKSYIVVTFSFLAIAFYQQSGGADYAPRNGSLQAEAPKLRAARAARLVEAPRTQFAKPERANSRTATPQPPRPSVLAALSAGTAPVIARPAVNAPALTRASVPADAIPATTTAGRIPTAAQQLRLESYSLTRLGPQPAAPALQGNAAETGAGTPVPAAVPADDIRSVLKSRVNLRVGPGTEYDVLGKLDEGVQVQVLETATDGWVRLRVLDSGRIGWMAETLITAAN